MRAALRLAGLVLALAVACGRDGGEPAPATPPVALAPAPGDGRLDPERYRARIEETEDLLYSADALSEEDWKALSKALLDLHNEIVFGDVSATARDASARLFFLSARAEAMTSARRGDAELAQLRELWLSLCEDKFTPAAWIRAGSEAR